MFEDDCLRWIRTCLSLVCCLEFLLLVAFALNTVCCTATVGWYLVRVFVGF